MDLLDLTQFIPKKILAQFLPSLFPQIACSVGLDYSDGEIRLVELQNRPTGIELSHAYAGVIEGDPVSAVKKAFQTAQISSTAVRVAISGEGVVVRYIVLPRMKKEEIPQVISLDLEKHIPYKATDVIADHQFLEETPEKKMRVLLVAVRRSLVGSLIDFLKQAELVPVLVDVAGFAVSNAFVFNKIHPQPSEAIGVIHMTKDLTHVNVIKNQLGYFTRDIGLGQSKLKSDPAFLVDLANEVRLSFDYYESQHGDSLKAVYMSGKMDQASMEPFQKNLGLPVSFWDPLKTIAISSPLSKDPLQRIKPDLHLALGLALRPV